MSEVTDAQYRTVWDYKTVVLTHGFMGWTKDELDRPRFESALDELGKEGFELIWVFMDQKLHKEKDGHVLIFKRRMNQPI
jgi:hypothetical protein